MNMHDSTFGRARSICLDHTTQTLPRHKEKLAESECPDSGDTSNRALTFEQLAVQQLGLGRGCPSAHSAMSKSHSAE